jgi:hypothetical protein
VANFCTMVYLTVVRSVSKANWPPKCVWPPCSSSHLSSSVTFLVTNTGGGGTYLLVEGSGFRVCGRQHRRGRNVHDGEGCGGQGRYMRMKIHTFMTAIHSWTNFLFTARAESAEASIYGFGRIYLRMCPLTSLAWAADCRNRHRRARRKPPRPSV